MLRQFKHLSQFYPKHQRIIDASDHRMPHLTYPRTEAEKLQVQHFKPEKFADWSALFTVKFIKKLVDLASGYSASNIHNMTEKKWLTRTLLLETMSVVPGMVASMCRHMRALRKFKKDKGWIQQLLEQADNERFHYFTIISLRKPSYLMRLGLGMMQAVFVGQVFLGYTLSARHAHKFVGYLEEEAFKHYTQLISQIDRKGSPISHWKDTPASQQVMEYYKFDKDATLRDMFLMIRADELCHNEINHFLAQVNKNFDINEQKERMYQDKHKQGVKQKVDEQNISNRSQSSKKDYDKAQS